MPLTNENKNKLRELRDNFENDDHIFAALTYDLANSLLTNEVCIGIDRNTCNDFIARGKELDVRDLKFTLPYQAMVLEVNRDFRVPLNVDNFEFTKSIEPQKVVDTFQEKQYVDIKLTKIYMFNGNITENNLQPEDVEVVSKWSRIIDRIINATSEEELNLIHTHILDSVFGETYQFHQFRELDKELEQYRTGIAMMKEHGEMAGINMNAKYIDLISSHDANNILTPNRFACLKKSMLLAIRQLPLWNLISHSYDFESTDRQGICAYVEIESIDGTVKWYYMMFMKETVSGLFERFSYLQSLDGISNFIHHDMSAIIKGFVNAWNKKAITEVWKKRHVRMPSVGRQKYRFKKIKEKFFKYDSEKGRIEVTKTVVVDPAPEIRVSQGGIKSPHMRSECMAYVWVSIKNVGKDEEWIDEKETKNNILVKVLRPRAAAKVNGGGSVQAQIRCN